MVLILQEKSSRVLSTLLERCDHFSDEISIVTLRLFETIISKKDPTAMNILVLAYLKDRGYHAKNPGNLCTVKKQIYSFPMKFYMNWICKIG